MRWQEGIVGSDSVMVGDRHHDALGAVENSMDFVGALYGFGSADEFRGNGLSLGTQQRTARFVIAAVPARSVGVQRLSGWAEFFVLGQHR